MGFSPYSLVAGIFVSVILPPGSAPPLARKRRYTIEMLDKAAET